MKNIFKKKVADKVTVETFTKYKEKTDTKIKDLQNELDKQKRIMRQVGKMPAFAVDIDRTFDTTLGPFIYPSIYWGEWLYLYIDMEEYKFKIEDCHGDIVKGTESITVDGNIAIVDYEANHKLRDLADDRIYKHHYIIDYKHGSVIDCTKLKEKE